MMPPEGFDTNYSGDGSCNVLPLNFALASYGLQCCIRVEHVPSQSVSQAMLL